VTPVIAAGTKSWPSCSRADRGTSMPFPWAARSGQVPSAWGARPHSVPPRVATHHKDGT